MAIRERESMPVKLLPDCTEFFSPFEHTQASYFGTKIEREILNFKLQIKFLDEFIASEDWIIQI